MYCSPYQTPLSTAPVLRFHTKKQVSQTQIVCIHFTPLIKRKVEEPALTPKIHLIKNGFLLSHEFYMLPGHEF